MIDIKKILACPRCKIKISFHKNEGKCQKCHLVFPFRDKIWELLYITDKKTRDSLTAYDNMHQKFFDGPEDGSYEILGKIARGNLAVDIASGDGFIEQFTPETICVEFSKNALTNAKKVGAKHLVLADAHHLPFIDNAFEISISSGNLEQFANPGLAVSEMVRISKIQILTVHKEFNIPFASQIRSLFAKATGLKQQPIEKPMKIRDVETMLESNGTHIVYKGVWTIPVNLGKVVKFLPEFKNVPSCFFLISIKK